MKTRVIQTKIWKDPYFHSLKQDEAHFFIYLLTNENINMVGTYELCDEEVTLWVKIPPKRIQEIKSKFQKDGKFVFYKGWVKVVNHERYNNYGKGDRQKVAYERELALIPTLDTSIDTSMYTGIDTTPIPTINPKSKIIIQKEGGVGGEKKWLHPPKKI